MAFSSHPCSSSPPILKGFRGRVLVRLGPAGGLGHDPNTNHSSKSKLSLCHRESGKTQCRSEPTACKFSSNLYCSLAQSLENTFHSRGIFRFLDQVIPDWFSLVTRSPKSCFSSYTMTVTTMKPFQPPNPAGQPRSLGFPNLMNRQL